MVTTTDSMGSKIDITNKKEMELAILESNKTKFTQSSYTPFYLPPLKDDFGIKGLTAAAQASLAGLYESNFDFDDRLLEVIAQWKMP